MSKNHKGSLFYQLLNSKGLNINANRPGGITTSFKTQQNYKKSLHYAVVFFKAHGIRNADQLDIAAIQKYSDFLCGKGYAPSTVHTYLAPVCKAVGISMDRITKPIRYVSEFTKCRTSAPDTAEDGNNLTILLNSYLGLRRCELTRLHGDDLHQDRYDNWYVFVDRGKGGKAQRQYVLPQHVDNVKTFFDGDKQLLFRKSDMDAKFSYHGQRHVLAKEAYKYYADRINADPAFAKDLYKNIAESWHQLNKRDRADLEPRSYFEKPYLLRGKNRELAMKTGKPIVYDRLALRAVSVLHLAHWRDNITVNYLLS